MENQQSLKRKKNSENNMKRVYSTTKTMKNSLTKNMNNKKLRLQILELVITIEILSYFSRRGVKPSLKPKVILQLPRSIMRLKYRSIIMLNRTVNLSVLSLLSLIKKPRKDV